MHVVTPVGLVLGLFFSEGKEQGFFFPYELMSFIYEEWMCINSSVSNSVPGVFKQTPFP